MIFPRPHSSTTSHLVLLTVATALATVAQAQNTSSSKDSVVRNDPIIIVDGNRISQDGLTSLQNDTVQVEVLRGRATVPFGDDAEGGVLKITTKNGGTASGSDGSPTYGQGAGMDGMGMGGVPGGMGSMGSMGGMGGMGGMGMGGMGSMGSMGGMGMGGMPGRGQMDGRSGMGGMNGGSTPSAAPSGPAIYPITVVSGSRVTDNDLYKIKTKMNARIEVLDSAAATAKYGNGAAAGAILITPLKDSSKAKSSKSSKSTPKKSSAKVQ